LLVKVQTEVPITAIEFHPDGLVLGVGLENGTVVIYDIRTQDKAITLDGPVKGTTSTAVSQIRFSNKGFHLAVAWED
jgi:pre-mRNA-processing factor 19